MSDCKEYVIIVLKILKPRMLCGIVTVVALAPNKDQILVHLDVEFVIIMINRNLITINHNHHKFYVQVYENLIFVQN